MTSDANFIYWSVFFLKKIHNLNFDTNQILDFVSCSTLTQQYLLITNSKVLLDNPWPQIITVTLHQCMQKRRPAIIVTSGS